MDIGRAFGFVFQDPNWIKKIVIGGILLIIPIFGWFVVSGYSIKVMRNIIAGSDLPLPEWEDFGALFMDGLSAFVIAFIWYIPFAIVAGILNRIDGLVFQCLSAIIGVILAVILAAVIPPFAQSAKISDGLQFGVIINRVMANLGDYITIYILGFVLAFIAVAGLIGLCIGVLFTSMYVALVEAHLATQAYKRSIGLSTPSQQAF
jgi:uncharacterized membrane protein YjgN (DUF898 family)